MRKLYLFLFVVFYYSLYAQTVGQLDTSYGVDGYGYNIVNFGFRDSNVTSQEIQQDGKLIVAGYVSMNSDDTATYKPFMIRFNIDGRIDTDFGTNGIVLINKPGLEFYTSVVKMKSDGKILFGARGFLSQYNENGVLDNSFGTNGTVIPIFYVGWNIALYIKEIDFQSDGSIIVLGGCESNSQYKTVFVYKYDTNGVLIPAFGSSINHNGTPYHMIVQDDDSIVFDVLTAVSTSVGFYVRKLTADGTPSLLQTISDRGLNYMTKGSNGKYIVNYSDLPYTNTFTSRYNTNMNLDTTFGNGLATVFPKSLKINYLPDGRLLFLENNPYGFTFYGANEDGALDNTFANQGILHMTNTTDKLAVDFDVFNENFYISGNTTQSGLYQKDIFITKAFYQYQLGIPNLSDVGVKIYPNPSSDYIKFENLKTIEKVKIVNLQGQVVKTREVSDNEMLDIKDLSKGLYLLQFENLKTIKLVKK